jgi:hypothetical protein
MSQDDGDPPESPYKVGYRKPPTEHQFKPGHQLSKGRRKGSRNTKALIVEEWHKRQPAFVNGKRKHVSRSLIGARKLTAKGSDGDTKAFELILKAEAEIAEGAAAREIGSRFSEPADGLAMADIVRRLRALPHEETTQVPNASDGSEERIARSDEDDSNAADLPDEKDA